jgi:hypothetical protein
MKRHSRIDAYEKKIAQARKELELQESAGQNLNGLAAKVDSRISTYESTINELKAA